MDAPRTLMTFSCLLVFALLLAPLTPAAAQDLQGPLVAKAEEKADAAQDDPTGFATDQASDERLAEDAEWGIAYGCYAGYIATDEAGLPPPDLDQCDDFEEALGIAEEEQVEEAVADAEGLEDGTRAEAEAIIEDLEATLGRIVDEPTRAVDHLQALLERTLRGLERIIDGIDGFAENTAEGLQVGGGILMKGAGHAVAAPAFALYTVATTLGSLVATTATGVGVATAVIGDAVAETTRVVASAATAGASGARDGFDALTDGIGQTLERLGAALTDLLGGDPAAASPDAAPVGDPKDAVDGTAETLLDPVSHLVDETTPDA